MGNPPIDRSPPFVSWSDEKRYRFIAEYKDENGVVVSVISEVDAYYEIKNKRDEFLKNVNSIGTLIFSHIVSEAGPE